MSLVERPRGWLCGAAFAAAFWIALRVMTASAAALPAVHDVDGAAVSVSAEIRDPALEALIARFAKAARTVPSTPVRATPAP